MKDENTKRGVFVKIKKKPRYSLPLSVSLFITCSILICLFTVSEEKQTLKKPKLQVGICLQKSEPDGQAR